MNLSGTETMAIFLWFFFGFGLQHLSVLADRCSAVESMQPDVTFKERVGLNITFPALSFKLMFQGPDSEIEGLCFTWENKKKKHRILYAKGSEELQDFGKGQKDWEIKVNKENEIKITDNSNVKVFKYSVKGSPNECIGVQLITAGEKMKYSFDNIGKEKECGTMDKSSTLNERPDVKTTTSLDDYNQGVYRTTDYDLTKPDPANTNTPKSRIDTSQELGIKDQDITTNMIDDQQKIGKDTIHDSNKDVNQNETYRGNDPDDNHYPSSMDDDQQGSGNGGNQDMDKNEADLNNNQYKTNTIDIYSYTTLERNNHTTLDRNTTVEINEHTTIDRNMDQEETHLENNQNKTNHEGHQEEINSSAKPEETTSMNHNQEDPYTGSGDDDDGDDDKDDKQETGSGYTSGNSTFQTEGSNFNQTESTPENDNSYNVLNALAIAMVIAVIIFISLGILYFLYKGGRRGWRIGSF